MNPTGRPEEPHHFPSEHQPLISLLSYHLPSYLMVMALRLIRLFGLMYPAPPPSYLSVSLSTKPPGSLNLSDNHLLGAMFSLELMKKIEPTRIFYQVPPTSPEVIEVHPIAY